jgi:serine/threonine-protein kinase
MSLQSAFEELIELAPERRAARLRELPLTDRERERLASMLDEATLRHPLLDAPLGDVLDRLEAEAQVSSSLVGSMVGPFRVLEAIGEGGSASVYRAARPAGSGEQQVALKVLRASLFSADGERRFRREQAILAQLTHPNVARLIEGGVDASGHAYIALELVDGEPVTRAASRRGLGIDARLEWFVVLCRAIDAAHHALIVHCDLKPSNVLVDSHGVLKVLDFGIARLIDASRDDAPTKTIALTPEYAAPEQFQIGPPRTSVDVYALGVILGELLTAQRLGAGAKASAALLDADAPEPPRGLPRRDLLARRLAGELDAIIAMATDPDPALRYQSPGALADDVERYRSARPVHACFPTRRYRLRKFISRHRVSVATVALVLLSLCAGLALAWWQAIAAQRAAREAQAQAARADSMRNMVFDVLSEAEPVKPRAAETTVTEAAERAIGTLLGDRNADPRARLELLSRFADTVGKQGHPDRAQELLERALGDARELLGANDALTLSIDERIADYDMQRGAYPQARERLDRLLAQVPPGPSELRVKVLRASASVAWRTRERERALRDGQLSVALSREVGDAELERSTLTYYANMLLSVDAVRDAADIYEKLLALNIAKFGPVHEQVALVYSGLGRAYRRLGDLDKAQDYAQRAIDIDRQIYPHEHLITATHINSLQMVLIQKRDFAHGIDNAREGLRIVEATLDPDHLDRFVYTYQLGYVLYAMERYDEALPHLRTALEGETKLLGAADLRTNIVRAVYGNALALGGDVQRGIAEIEGALAQVQAAASPDFDIVAKTIERLIRLSVRGGDVTKADSLLPALDAAAGKVIPTDRPWWSGKADTIRALVMLAQKRPREARDALLRAGAALAAQPSSDLVEPVEQRLLLAQARIALKDPAAKDTVAQARELLARLPSPPSRLAAIADALNGER